MDWSKSTWRLPVILIGIHFALQTFFFISAQTSRDPEAGLSYAVVGSCIAYPASLAVNRADNVVWEKKILWYSDVLYVSKVDHYVDRFFGITKQTVEDFITFVQFVMAGTLQWGIVGVLMQSALRRLRRRERTRAGIPETS